MLCPTVVYSCCCSCRAILVAHLQWVAALEIVLALNGANRTMRIAVVRMLLLGREPIRSTLLLYVE